MPQARTLGFLVFCIALLASLAAAAGIFTNEGPGPYEHLSIRGEQVTIYGRGIYHHMSAQVAPQGIAQDYVTVLLGVPLLLMSFLLARSGSLPGRFLLAGTLSYFFVTYLFYLVMGMYNVMFLAYVFLLSAAFFALALTLLSFDVANLPAWFRDSTPVAVTGGFLMFNAVCIALLWLGIVVSPLLDGSIFPPQLEHYTTLVVQGLDLAILLPLGILAGVLFIRRKPFGYLLGPTYFVFLSLLMTALTAKVIAMALLGYNVVPIIFIIPTFNVVSLVCTVLILQNINQNVPRRFSEWLSF